MPVPWVGRCAGRQRKSSAKATSQAEFRPGAPVIQNGLDEKKLRTQRRDLAGVQGLCLLAGPAAAWSIAHAAGPPGFEICLPLYQVIQLPIVLLAVCKSSRNQWIQVQKSPWRTIPTLLGLRACKLTCWSPLHGCLRFTVCKLQASLVSTSEDDCRLALPCRLALAGVCQH